MTLAPFSASARITAMRCNWWRTYHHDRRWCQPTWQARWLFSTALAILAAFLLWRLIHG